MAKKKTEEAKPAAEEPTQEVPASEPEAAPDDLGLGLSSETPPQDDAEAPADETPEATEEAPTETHPEAAADTPEKPTEEPPQESVESLRAKLQEKETQLETVRQGFVRDMSSLRQQLAQYRQAPAAPAAAPTQAEVAAAQTAGIPVEFRVDEKGNTVASIPPAALGALREALQEGSPQPDPVRSLEAAYGQWRLGQVMRDPVTVGPALSRIDEAFDFLHSRTIAKQAEMGLSGFSSYDDMVQFLDRTGLVEEAKSAYPDVLPDIGSAVALVEARNTLSDYKLRGVLEGYLTRKGGNGVAAPAQPSTPPRPVPETRPRSQAERGRAPRETANTRLDELRAKDPLDRLSDSERQEFRSLLGQLDMPDPAAP